MLGMFTAVRICVRLFLSPPAGMVWFQMALFHCMVWQGTVWYGSVLEGFPLGTVHGTWYFFFSTTSTEVPSEPYRYQNVTCKPF